MKIHKPGLAGRLALVTVVLVTLAVAAVSIFGVRSLRRLAEAEALTRVELAVSASRESLRRSTEDLLTASRVLGERPTLQRLLAGSSQEAVESYLTRYCEGALLDGCAVMRDGELIASVGRDVDWPRVLTAADEQGERFFVSGAAPGVLSGGAKAPLVDDQNLVALTVRRLDEAFAAELSERAGVTIRIIDYALFRPGEGPFAVLSSDALARGEPVAAHIVSADVYAASLPVAAATGETIALLQAMLPARQVMDPVDTSTRRMLAVAILIALLATTAGIAIGRQWISGVYRLTDAARRIGAGDLAAAIPPEGGKELSVLAGTMDEMRRNLIGLTSELRRREAEAQAVLGGIVEGVYAVDDARRIRFLNPQAERLLQVSSEDAIGRFCGDVLKPAVDAEGRRPCETSCPIVKARREGAAQAIERIAPAADRRRVVIASAAPADGVQVQVLRDETELEAVRRTRDSILANISHEFRTPLAAQLASIELLRDGLDDMAPAAQRQLVGTLERGVQRLTWLIDNLLESVRIESGQLSMRRQIVSLDRIIASALELIGPLIEQREQRLELTTDFGGLPSLHADEQRLTQVVVNLLGNANKFSPAGSTIRVGARMEGVLLKLWIEDEGEGPAETDAELLFEQFRRAKGEDPVESGIGLGLYIVRSIVERHGGRVGFVRTPALRTRVEVELPTAAGQSERDGREVGVPASRGRAFGGNAR